MSNPFNFGTPVPPHRMVGRWHQVEYVARDLVNLGGLSHMVVGGRRFGKSSFLEALHYSLIKQIHQGRAGNWYFIPVLVNLQRLTEHSPGGVFDLILNLLYMCFDHSSATRTLGHHFPMDLEKTKLYSYIQREQRECPLGEFSKIIDDFLSMFLNRHGNLRLIFLIDEIENTLNKDWTETLFNHLRALIYEGFLRDYIRYVIVGSSGVIDVRESGSQLLNMLDVLYLEVLSDDDILKIINLANGVPAGVAHAILKQSGGHPFIAQYLMYRIWEYGTSKTTRTLVARLVNRFISERYADLKKWQFEIGEAGQITYAALAEANRWLTVEQVRQLVNIPGLDIQRRLDTLCYHGLAIRDDKWHSYHVTGELFKEWFKQNVLPSLQIPHAAQAPTDSLSTQRKVFISYSHKDAKWLERLRVHLKPVEREGIIDLWDDTKITAGVQWKEAIMDALETARVAVLLVSANFLASDFIAEHELPTLLTRAKAGGTTIIPVILSPSLFSSTSLGSFQSLNAPDNPISDMTFSKQEQVFVKVAQTIMERFKAE